MADNQSELERQVHKLFGDHQGYDGGYQSCYDGKWIDMTNEVCAVADYITANYTPNSTVESLNSQIAWLDGKVEEMREEAAERERLARINEGQLFREAMIEHSAPAIYWGARLDELTKAKENV